MHADLMALSFERRLPTLGLGACLELGRVVAAQEVRQVDGGLRVLLPVEQRDEGLRYIANDVAAAGRAGDGIKPAEGIEDDRRRHRAAGAIEDRFGARLMTESGAGESSGK